MAAKIDDGRHPEESRREEKMPANPTGLYTHVYYTLSTRQNFQGGVDLRAFKEALHFMIEAKFLRL